MASRFSESIVEEAALSWLESLDTKAAGGPNLSPGGAVPERATFSDVVLQSRFFDALRRLNPTLPTEAIDAASRKLLSPEGGSLISRNRIIHRFLVDGVTIEYRREDGSIAGAQARVLDFDEPDNNDWLAVNQFTVLENRVNRRADIVLFVNGLPLGLLELKNPTDENATVESAYQQLQTYKQEIPSLLAYNATLVISDGTSARVGTLTSDFTRFMPWRTIDGRADAPTAMPELQVVLEGLFDKRRFLDLIRFFTVFEDFGGGKVEKKIAGYHQYHAVNVAVEETLRASLPVAAEVDKGRYMAAPQPGGEPGDKRVGVIWHTQGSGKSLTMAFYAGRLVAEPAMQNPTIVMLTDRNDLDGQLFGVFARCKELFRQDPVQAEDRAHLRDLLSVNAGGVVFTTIQKFFPEEKGDKHPLLSNRRNIVVMADEAHRSQYDFIDGYARHMRDALPSASFIGFTGTPIELDDKNTRSVFGDYISIYDIQRAVRDHATVPIYYESRLAKLTLDEQERPKIDPSFEEVTEGEEVERKEKLKTRWAALEAIVGSQKRVDLLARDLVEHWEKRLHSMDGKAMLVCMSRRICIDLYNALAKLRPQWVDDDDAKGILKVIMTGNASEGPEYAKHARNKPRRDALADRFRDDKDPFRIVIVRDMWLTGFDAPSLHTMYVDKPMRGHGLMQAIARVNRVFKDKSGGLVVDYLGLGPELSKAVQTYTEAGGRGDAFVDQKEALRALKEKYEVCRALFHGFDWSKWVTGKPTEKLALLPAAQEHILKQKEGKERFIAAVNQLTQAFALAVPHEEALKLQEDVGFFQAVRANLAKRAPGEAKSDEELEHAIRQIVSQAVSTDQVVDIFAAAGLKKPDISILSDDFLAQVKDMPHKNLAVELLHRLLNGEIRTRSRRNIVQGRTFSELLEKSIRKYQNRAIETAAVIEELIGLAKELRTAAARGSSLGLTEEETAFYDALETNDSAVKILGEPTLKMIAQELANRVRESASIDWTLRENVRAQLRVLVKRILRKYGYPPDKQEKAADLVLQQAEALAPVWAAA